MSGRCSSPFKVQYKAADANPTNVDVKPHFNVANMGTSSVPLTELTIRYWYTLDVSERPQSFFCDYALVGCANVSGKFVKLPAARSGADHYLEVAFTAGAGNCVAAAQTGEIQVRFNITDYTPMNEAGDYSFDPTKTGFADWGRVTLYQNGVLVWGTEP
jgi:hypothetical protein